MKEAIIHGKDTFSHSGRGRSKEIAADARVISEAVPASLWPWCKVRAIKQRRRDRSILTSSSLQTVVFKGEMNAWVVYKVSSCPSEISCSLMKLCKLGCFWL